MEAQAQPDPEERRKRVAEFRNDPAFEMFMEMIYKILIYAPPPKFRLTNYRGDKIDFEMVQDEETKKKIDHIKSRVLLYIKTNYPEFYVAEQGNDH